MQPLAAAEDLVLGLDIGSRSVGWALIRRQDGKPKAIEALGVRIFEAGVEGNLEQGKEESKSAHRRLMRQQRRQTSRRRKRRLAVYRLLVANGLLPEANLKDPDAIHAAIELLDARLRERHLEPGDHRSHQVLPYLLRAKALDQALEPFELGRALYHLAQRRGFRSNRKVDASREDEGKVLGQVKEGIASLEEEMQQANSRTLGEHFSRLDPDTRRIRNRWTSRAMYQKEFDAIWSAQSSTNASLSPQLKQELWRAVFYQRPLKSQKGLVGLCSLEPSQRRAALARLECQRFRLLQKLNDLEVYHPEGHRERPTPDQRATLLDLLEREGDLSTARIKKVLGIKGGRAKLNFEEGGEKSLPGNRTAKKISDVFGVEHWIALTEAEREQVVEDLQSIVKYEALEQRGKKRWGLNKEAAARFKDLELERGYAALSLRAIRKLLPLLESGQRYSEARKQVYPASYQARPPVDRLPPVIKALARIRNPAVVRSLTEVRRVVQAVLNEYGKPSAIHIELARDLKQPRKVREDRWERSRARQKTRKAAAERLMDEAQIESPRPGDIEKVLLADECGWTCPYTGRSFGMQSLIGPSATLEVEHILPYSRTLDDSFLNKTVCWNEENRRKHDRTPYEAYGSDGPRWNEILARVRRFQGDDRIRRAKLERFLCRDLGKERLDAFAESQLSDTRYASVESAEYLALLYGGLVDSEGRRRIQTSAGGATAILRNEWGLNGLLKPGQEGKVRDDHRHHAVDAVVIALTGPSEVQRIALAAEQAATSGSRRRLAQIDPPWEGFRDELRTRIESTVVSHRVNHVLRGKLHLDSNWSVEHTVLNSKGKQSKVRHIRKPLCKLSMREVKNIVDHKVRELVATALESMASKDPESAFAMEGTHPVMKSRRGPRPIHKVRIKEVKLTVVSVGQGSRTRYVKPEGNHHMTIVAVLGPNGEDQKWEQAEVVSLLEANRRRLANEPIVRRSWGPGKAFRFTVSAGDCLGRTREDGSIAVFRVAAVSDGVIEYLAGHDARPSSDIREAGVAGGRYTGGPDSLRRAGLSKVTVSPLGWVTPARD